MERIIQADFLLPVFSKKIYIKKFNSKKKGYNRKNVDIMKWLWREGGKRNCKRINGLKFLGKREKKTSIHYSSNIKCSIWTHKKYSRKIIKFTEEREKEKRGG